MRNFVQYIADYFGIDSNTAANLFVTVLVFVIGYILTVSGYLIKRHFERLTYKRSLKLIITDFFKSCKRQSKEFDTFFDQAGFLYGSDYVIKFTSNYTQNFLANIEINDFTKHFYTYCNKKRPKVISKLFEQVDIVKRETESLKEIINIIFDKYAKHESEYAQALDTLRKFHDDLGLKYDGVTLIADEGGNYVQFIFSTFGNWSKAGQKKEIANTYSELVKPILDHSRSEKKLQLSQFAINECLSASLAYENMLKLKAMLEEQIKHSAFLHKRAYRLGQVINRNL